jgi:hypothetical protein
MFQIYISMSYAITLNWHPRIHTRTHNFGAKLMRLLRQRYSITYSCHEKQTSKSNEHENERKREREKQTDLPFSVNCITDESYFSCYSYACWERERNRKETRIHSLGRSVIFAAVTSMNRVRSICVDGIYYRHIGKCPVVEKKFKIT